MAKHRLLSIDDSKAVHAFLDRSLVGSSFELVHALSGQAGLDQLKENGSTFDLILLDWEMPEKSGPEVLAEIRKSGNSIPIIMLTSKDKPEDILSMLGLGATEYIMKPFTPDILIEKLAAILGDA